MTGPGDFARLRRAVADVQRELADLVPRVDAALLAEPSPLLRDLRCALVRCSATIRTAVQAPHAPVAPPWVTKGGGPRYRQPARRLERTDK